MTRIWRKLGGRWWYWTRHPDGTIGYPLGHRNEPPRQEAE